MNFLKIEDRFDPALSDAVIAAHLDSPTHGTVLSSDSQIPQIVISGWVLARDPACQIALGLRLSTGETKSVPLSIKRNDVIRRILGTDCDSRLVCGFRIQIEAAMPIELLFSVDGNDLPWKQIIREPVDADWLQQVRGAWERAISGALPSETDLGVLKDLNRSSMDLVVTPKIIACHDSKTLLRLGGLSQDEFPRVEDFFRTVDSPDLPANMVKAALENACVGLVNPFTGRMATCSRSWIADGKTNCLLFIDQDEVFFVLQHVTASDAVYFPKRNIAVFRRHLTIPDIQAVAYGFSRQLPRLLSASGVTSDGFAGILASHGRPYHFFYDVAPALELLDKSGLLHQVPEVFVLEGADYFPIEKIYAFPGKTIVAPPDAMNEQVVSRGQFLVHVGIQFGQPSLGLIQRMDGRLLDRLPELISNEIYTEIQVAQRCFPLVWFGVTGQKRAWQEQAEAAVCLINALRPLFPGIGLCIDGWTSPIGPTKRDEVESENDRRVLEDILAGLPDGMPVFDLIGANCVRKLAFAQVIDLFVANHATGSIYVARFGGKPGIGHINNSMNCDGHIHPRTTRVPLEFVTDVVSKERLRPDFISYHIAPETIIRQVSELLSGTDWLAERGRTASWISKRV